MYVNILLENVSHLTDWLTDKIKSNLRTFTVLVRHLNPVALTGEINHSETVISRRAPRHSRQMFQPSGNGSIWILTTRVQATCNLQSTVYITSFKGHYLCHYNSSPLFTARTTPRRLSEPMDAKRGMQLAFYESARRAYSHVRCLTRMTQLFNHPQCMFPLPHVKMFSLNENVCCLDLKNLVVA